MSDEKMRAEFEAWLFTKMPADKIHPASLGAAMSGWAWEAWQASRAVVPSVAVPDGWKLVPKCPTTDMLYPIKDAAPKWNARSIYAAILDAAPAASGASEDALAAMPHDMLVAIAVAQREELNEVHAQLAAAPAPQPGAEGRVGELCHNCATALPEGCKGIFRNDGDACALNRAAIAKGWEGV